jgi:hypothetical protein
MTVSDDADQQAYPAFAHQIEALLRRMAREDREAIGATLRRARIPVDDPETGPLRGGGRGRTSTASNLVSDAAGTMSGRSAAGKGNEGRSVDFSRASPLSDSPRQTGRVRIPHLDIYRVSRTVVPRSKSGQAHHRFPDKSGSIAQHHEYVTAGGIATFRDHHAYLTRASAVELKDTAGLFDILDMEDERKLQNDLAIFSNIPGGRARERSLFDAAERCERQAKGGVLTVSTEHADEWMAMTMKSGSPPWVRAAAFKLRKERQRRAKLASQKGRASSDTSVEICKVDLEQAYDRLTWCDKQPDLPESALPRWKAGPCGRVQTRFVADLPKGIAAHDRREILERVCGMLADQGWMLVGAIHRPDPKTIRTISTSTSMVTTARRAGATRTDAGISRSG